MSWKGASSKMQTRSLYIPDTELIRWKDVGVYLYEADQNTVTSLSSFSPTGEAFQFYEVSVVEGKGSWWLPTVQSSATPSSWKEDRLGGTEDLVASGEGIWTIDDNEKMVRPTKMFWWLPEQILGSTDASNVPSINTGKISGPVPTLEPLASEDKPSGGDSSGGGHDSKGKDSTGNGSGGTDSTGTSSNGTGSTAVTPPDRRISRKIGLRRKRFDTRPNKLTAVVEQTLEHIKIMVPPSQTSTVIDVTTGNSNHVSGLDASNTERPTAGAPDNPSGRSQAFLRERFLNTENIALESSTSQIAETRQNGLHEYRDHTRENLADQQPNSLVLRPAVRLSSQTKRQARFAQPANPTGFNWVPIGPSVVLNGQMTTRSPISGRVRGIAISSDGQRIYLASANGGVWRSDDRGHTWYPLMNGFDLHPAAIQSDSLSAGAIAIHPEYPDRVYVGTGEATTNEDRYFGVGPVVSDDGGVNWRPEKWDGNTGSGFFELAVDPTDPERVVGAAIQGIFRRQPRNQDVPGLPDLKPQSYLLKLDTNTGAPLVDYWDAEGLGTVNVWGQGVVAWTAAATKLVPFTYKGEPRCVRYVPSTAAYSVDRLTPDGGVHNLQAGNWINDLLVMPFELGGNAYWVKFDPATNNASLDRWQDDGTFTNIWNGHNWPPPIGMGGTWSALVPFVLHGVPHFLRYRSGDGTTELDRWDASLNNTRVRPINWPNNATLMPFELEGESYILLYQANNGNATLYRWEPDGQEKQIWSTNAALPQNLELTPFVFKGKTPDQTGPRFLAYNNGTTSLYVWKSDLKFKLIWTRTWPQNLTFMPFLMGYQWVNKQKNINPLPTGESGTPRQPKATSIVVAHRDDITVFFAAFWGRGQIYISLDHGDHWEQLGVFPENKGRIVLAVQPTNTKVIYALTSTSEVYRYERNAGADRSRWRQIRGGPDNAVLATTQGWYDLTMAVAPDDVNRIYLGGSTVSALANRDEDWSGSIYRCEVTVHDDSLSMAATYIAASVHGDIQTLVFTPGQANALWVGCDGGIFYAPNVNDAKASVLDTLFEHKNTGLSTMTVNHIDQVRGEDALMFSSNQDNGCEGYTGGEVWRVLNPSDSGYVVVFPDDPRWVICSVFNKDLKLSDDGGVNFFSGNGQDPNELNLALGDGVNFYAPLVGVPQPDPPTATVFSFRIAFGTRRPWVSEDFGEAAWQSIPNNNNNLVGVGGDRFGDDDTFNIRSMAFSHDGLKLYVGLNNGWIYKYRDTGALGVGGLWAPAWNSVGRIDSGALAPGGALPAALLANPVTGILGNPVTSIYVDPGNNDSIFVTFGGRIAANGWRRVWYFDSGAGGGTWQSRSGAGAGLGGPGLIDVQFNTIIARRVALPPPGGGFTTHLYAGADIGVWHAPDGQAANPQWAPFGQGLPEAPVLDLKFFPAIGGRNSPDILRAATHGRGVYERILANAVGNARQFNNPVQLYIRANLLDRGIYNVRDNIPNPLGGANVRLFDGVDIKASNPINPVIPPPPGTPYVFPKSPTITFTEFAELNDNSRNLTNGRDVRIYAQVHNRGVLPADGVRVVVLLYQVPVAGVIPRH